MNIAASEKPAEATAGIELSPQMRQLLEDPIVPTLLHMAWPNILIMLAQASTGLIETFWVARLGTDALAGMALVFPIVMMVQMMANGAMGGGISSAIARALGAGRRGEADAFVLHAMVINVMLGLGISFVMLALGKSGSIEPVDNAGDRAGGQASRAREFPGRDGAAHDDDIEAFEIGAVDAEALSDCLAVQHTLTAGVAHRVIERGHQFVSAHLPS